MVSINTNNSSLTGNASTGSFKPAITVTGLGSSFDTGAMVNSLVQVERLPILKLQQKQNDITTKISAIQDFKTLLTNLKTTVDSLSTNAKFVAKGVTFTNTDTSQTTPVASATADSTATVGTYALNVTQLATDSKVASQGYASATSAFNQRVSSMSISLASGDTATIDIAFGDTLTSVKDKINNAGIGVTASISNDGSASPYKLLIKSDSTGVNNQITVKEFFPDLQGGDIPTSKLNFTSIQNAQDASFTIDGLSYTKSSNTVTDALTGVTLDLNTTGAGSLDVGTDAATIKTNIKQFISDYNNYAQYVKAQTTYTPGQQSGTLFGDQIIKSAQSSLGSIISATVPGSSGSSYTSLASLGILSDRDGMLSLDETKLDTAINDNINEVINVFVASGKSSDTASVNYVSHGRNTAGGVYDYKVDGNGAVSFRLQGTSTYTAATASSVSGYYSGASGTAEEGLLVKVEPGVTNVTGTVSASKGVFDALNAQLYNLTNGIDGSVTLRERGFNETYNGYSSDISDLEKRISVKTDAIRTKFTKLESILSQMDSQKKYLTSQLASLPKTK